MATIAAKVPTVQETEELGTGRVRRRSIRVGLVGGVIAIYLSATGIVQLFNGKPIITDVIELGYALIIMVWLMTGAASTRHRTDDGLKLELPAAWRLASGAIAGAVAGTVLALFILLFSVIDLRDIFLNISPVLIEDTLSFGQGAAVGAIVSIVAGAVLGTLGAALTLMPRQNRTILLSAIIAVVVFGLLEQMIRVMLATLGLLTDWLYTGGGLTTSGALIVFVVAAVLAFVWSRRTRLFAGVIATDTAEVERARLLDRVALFVGLAAAALAAVLAVIGIRAEEPSEAVPVSLLGIALLLALVGLGLGAARSARDPATGARRGQGRFGFAAAGAALGALIPFITGSFLSNTMVTVMIYVLLGLGLNIVVGLAGLLDLGYVAFFAIGAYGLGLLTSPLSGLVAEGVGEFGSGSQVGGDPLTNFWVAVPIVVVGTILAGVLLGAPVVRLRGDYLAIVTLGFGEIIRVVVQSDWAGPLLGGSQGLKRIPAPPPASLDFRDPQKLYFLVLIASLLMAYVTWRLQYSRVGRAWAAMREDESVAEGMGISVIKYKLLAFAMGAGVASLGGIFFAAQLSVTTPESFQLLVSINVLAVIILGGLGSVPGVIVGAAVLVGLPELLREFVQYRLLFYGAALVAIMIFRPEGLVPNVRRRRELHERQLEEAQFAERVGAGGTEPDLTAAPSEERVPSEREDRVE